MNEFHDTIKQSEITPVFEKLGPGLKANFRPVLILPLVPKVFEKIVYDQLYNYMENFLNFYKSDQINLTQGCGRGGLGGYCYNVNGQDYLQKPSKVNIRSTFVQYIH